MLSLNDRICILLFLASDSYDGGLEDALHPQRYIYDSFSRGYHAATVRQRLWELCRSGDLAKRRVDNRVGYQLTTKGQARARNKIPLLKFRRDWDGLWRLAFFDIDEKHRNLRSLLRTKLRSLGFGPWQRSTWLTPFDVTADLTSFLEKVSLKGMVEVLEARRLFITDEKSLAARVWHLPNISQSYSDLAKDWEDGQTQYARNLPILKKMAASLEDRYLGLLALDPGLPKAFLPDSWPGDTVAKLFPEWVKIVM